MDIYILYACILAAGGLLASFLFLGIGKDKRGKKKKEGENIVGQWAFFGWMFCFWIVLI